MDIIKILKNLKVKGTNQESLLTGLGVEQVGKSIYLFYRLDTDHSSAIRLARSTDGVEFNLVKILQEEKYLRSTISLSIKKAIRSRIEYFDCGPIEFEGVVKVNGGNLVVYHHRNWPTGYQVGVAIIKNNKTVYRSESPLWESPTNWDNQEVNFVGLAYLDGRVVGYWQVDDQIQAVFYPSFKLRSSSVAKNIKVGLNRTDQNPIISPNPQNNWESCQTFNPGVILLDNKFRFLYRAIGDDGVSRLGYAVSDDGFDIGGRLPYPVYTHEADQSLPATFNLYPSGGSWAGAEDPRLVRVGNENTVYMTYTACNHGLRVGLTSISVDDFINGRWNWKPPICISPPGQIHKNWVIFPEKIRGHYAILHAITPKIHIEYFDDLDFKSEKYIEKSIDPQLIPPQNSSWDRRLRGAGSPPIKTDHGWLMFYHAMNYKVGVMLLDLNDPTKIICRSKAPVLESAEFYENNGFKPGVVYVSGAVIQDGKIYVYYGGADSYVCAASADLDTFLKQLRYSEPPTLEPARIIKII